MVLIIDCDAFAIQNIASFVTQHYRLWI